MKQAVMFHPGVWVIGFLILFQFATSAEKGPSRIDLGAQPQPVKVNRTVPQVEPPPETLTFTANPATREFFSARVFEEPLIPIGGDPVPSENAALATALLGYANRSGPDDFASVTGFLEKHPASPWRASLLTNLGLEYYNTAHYSQTIAVWTEAWKLAQTTTEPQGKAIADRAAGELASMYSRLGMMTELEALLKSIDGRVLTGPATEKISVSREALATMKFSPEISFRCGPMALLRIKLLVDPQNPRTSEIINSASTPKGLPLSEVAELSAKIGLNYQMAFRGQGGALVIPSLVHWKVDHYAALVRQDGERYLLEDPTFGNDVWVTKQALDAETSGYFLIPPGDLPRGWRAVDAREGASVWGKGLTPGNIFGGGGCKDPKRPTCPPQPGCGMAIASAHLMLVSLNIVDQPVLYSPPVGPAVGFVVTYNQREPFQPAAFTYPNFGPKWTFDWLAYIKDNPSSPNADVQYFLPGGSARDFTDFDSVTQTYAHEQYDQNRLKRTSPTSYEMLFPDGSKKIFSRSDGAVGTSRKIFLTQILDPSGNALTLTYEANLRLVAITDAIGQVTTLAYTHPTDLYKITRVTDPFGRFAAFDYDAQNRLRKITDVIGLSSEFTYDGSGDFINSLITPYGTTRFTRQEGGGPNGTTRALETLYPDGSRDRVEYNQYAAVPDAVPAASVPVGMATCNQYHVYRNTYYWSRQACAMAYGDYSKAKIYHWLHTPDYTATAGILESTKEPFEGRVWYDYAGQLTAYAVGTSNRPSHVGRVLDDGSTQLYTYTYDGFGHVTRSIDPLGRTMSYLYAPNGIDLLEVRQTRAGNNELLSRSTFNAQHLPLTVTDAAGQTTTFTYNARGQMLTVTNAKGETATHTYDADGHLITVDGPLPGTADTLHATYDAVGRTRTKTDESGNTLTFAYDAMDRLTKVSHPDSTSTEYIFDKLDPVLIQDRAGRQTFMEYDGMRQLVKRTDPLGRVSRFQWCSCGDLSSLTDPMGRTTFWHKDVQGRLTSKQYGDGSKVRYFYENTTSRLRQVVDEKQQVTQFTWNRDNTLNSTTSTNTAIPTPVVGHSYDPNYQRVTSMTDGTGTTLYTYHPVTVVPVLGAGSLASVDGPLPNDTITYGYDQLGRRVSTAINGVAATLSYDPAGRVIGETSALGSFTRAYDGASSRVVTQSFPNGQAETRGYAGTPGDFALQRITYTVGVTPVSEFLYGRDLPADRITTWSQQAGTQTPQLHTYGYDDANQLLSATVTVADVSVNTVGYTYDPAENRLTEQAGTSNHTASFNALNQISTSTAPASTRTNEWDARDRLVAVTAGNQRTEFTYDGQSQLASLRVLTNGVQSSLRCFVWCDNQICEERDGTGTLTKRFFKHGMKLESGSNAGNYFYTRDHLGSIREVTDSSGSVRARYAYDPFGRRTRVSGDLEADFGFAGMLWSDKAGLFLTQYRAYDPELGRWLSRDPLRNAEVEEGPNLYAYVRNNPVNATDPLGLCCERLQAAGSAFNGEKQRQCNKLNATAREDCAYADQQVSPGRPVPELQGNPFAEGVCKDSIKRANEFCDQARLDIDKLFKEYQACLKKPCVPPRCPPPEVQPHNKIHLGP